MIWVKSSQMPESSEVRTIVDVISKELEGKELTSIEVGESSKYSEGLDRYDTLIKPYLPLKIDRITCKGKQIFFRFIRSSEGSEYVIYLNSTLGMEGKWLWEKGNHSDLWLNIVDRSIQYKKIRIRVNGRKVYFDDSRHFGNLTIRTEEEYQIKLGQIGPDLLAENVTIDEWLRKARNGRIKNKQICSFLMEQKYFSGIGVYLKSEILYKSKIRPNIILNDLSDSELETILLNSLEIIRSSYRLGGLTVRSYWDPNGKKGSFQCLVYNKKFDPYGNPVITSTFKDNRTTHWVPSVQM